MKTSCRALLVLGMGCLAAAGATGCSARSLLDLDVDVQTDELLMDPSGARLHVEVQQGGRTVREGTFTRPLWNSRDELLASPRIQAGFYLDPDTSGDVTVHITIIDQQNCPMSDRKEINVAVTPGKARTVTVMIVITGPRCPGTEPDAGTPPSGNDAGAPDPGAPGQDGSADTGPGADAADGSDVYCPPETGAEVALPPSCSDFCTDAVKKCSQSYPNQDGCLTVCKTWRVGDLPSQSGTPAPMYENTLTCRAYWLNINFGTQQPIACMGAAEKSLYCTR